MENASEIEKLENIMLFNNYILFDPTISSKSKFILLCIIHLQSGPNALALSSDIKKRIKEKEDYVKRSFLELFELKLIRRVKNDSSSEFYGYETNLMQIKVALDKDGEKN